MKKRSFIFILLGLLSSCNGIVVNSSSSSSTSNSSYSPQEQNTSTNPLGNSSSSSSSSSSHTPAPPIPNPPTYEGDYYKSIDESKTGLSLRSALKDLITDTHKTYTTYDGLEDVYRVADADPEKPGNIIWFYSGTSISYKGLGGSVGATNREHVWPKDSGSAFPEKSGPGSDAHHLRPTECQMNSTRGSLSFGEVAQTASNIVKENGSTNYKNLCYKNSEFFYPGKGFRGATARILMYVQTRWGDQYNLKFVDTSGHCKTIGKISTLMKWHLTEPVSEAEITRNEEVFKIQGNRNPFIDHPEYATRIYCNDGESYNSVLKKVVEECGDYTRPSIESISVTPSALDLVVGQTSSLNVKVTPSSADNRMTYSSSNPSVAKVENGLVTALASGETTITVSSVENNNIKTTVQVVVKDLEKITLSGTITKQVYEEGEKVNPKGITVTAHYSDNTTKAISPLECLWLDGTTREEKLSLNTTSIICKYGNKEAVYNGITVNEAVHNGWELVENATDLASGDQIIIANSQKGVVAGNLNGAILSKVDATFDNNTLPNLPETALVFTLGYENGYWNLNCDSGSLGATATKKLAFDNGDINWSIEISDTLATIQNKTTSYGRFLYNAGSPRFTTYTSATGTNMLLPQIYKLN